MSVCERLDHLCLKEELLNDQLADSGFDVRWLLEILAINKEGFQEVLQKNNVKGVSTTDIGAGKGHLSRVYRVQIHFTNAKDDFEVVVKIPTIAVLNSVRAKSGQDAFARDSPGALSVFEAHNRECAFYDMIKDVAAECAHVPDVYYAQAARAAQPGVLVMESRAGDAASTPMHAAASRGQLRSVARCLAQLHANCMRISGQPWRAFRNSPLFTDYLAASIMPRYRPLLRQHFPDVHTAFDKLSQLANADFYNYALVERAVQMNAVGFVYGDCWSNNVLFKLNRDSSVSDRVATFVDLQMAGWGNSLFDLARFITICTCADIRREHASEILELYYTTLVCELYGTKTKVPFDRNQAQELFDLAFIHQSLYFVVLLPVTFYQTCGASAKVHEARVAKMGLRAKLALEDALELAEQYKLFEKFNKAK